MTPGARELMASGVCLVGIVAALAIVEPRAIDWLKIRLVAAVSAPTAVLTDVASTLVDAIGAAARRLSLWQTPVAILVLVAGVLVALLRRL